MLSKKDKIEIAEIVASVMKASNQTETKPVNKDKVKVATKPKKVVPTSQKPEILKKLTTKEIKELWGNLDTKNIFGKKYSCAHNLYKAKNIDGRPNISYSEAWNNFIMPIAKSNKKTTKQVEALRMKAIQQLRGKIKDNEEKQPRFWDKRNQWIEKGIEAIKDEASK